MYTSGSDEHNSDTEKTRRYHHGDLRQALIRSAEALIAEKGIAGFTLRECARRAGVSPSAPSHHFGHVAGLLSAIAALGFSDLANAMEHAKDQMQGNPGNEFQAIGEAYITIAMMNPPRFRITFGQMPLDWSNPELLLESQRAFGILERQVRMIRGVSRAGDRVLDTQASTVAAWSIVHGFSTLLLDGRLDTFTTATAQENRVRILARKMLKMLINGIGN
ncbi:MAG: TetR/AcrR family transcriptional regulator [Hyphomicrobiales bacterium]